MLKFPVQTPPTFGSTTVLNACWNRLNGPLGLLEHIEETHDEIITGHKINRLLLMNVLSLMNKWV